MMGKGDKPRPVNRQIYGANYTRIFGKRQAMDELVAEGERLGIYGGEKKSTAESRQEAGAIPATSTSKGKPRVDSVGSEHEIDWSND